MTTAAQRTQARYDKIWAKAEEIERKKTKVPKYTLTQRRKIRYEVYNKNIVYKKGFRAGYLRTFSNERDVKVFISGNPSAYMVKKVKY